MSSSSESEDIPLGKFASDSSDSEDVPLSQMKRKAPKRAPKKAPPRKRQMVSIVKKIEPHFIDKKLDIKPQLIDNILVRWTYCLPPIPKVSKVDVPETYVELAGFPGVFVGWDGDDIGKTLDLRPKDKLPTYNNLLKKSCAELKKLLINGIEKQRVDAVRIEGEESSLVQALDKEFKNVNSLTATQLRNGDSYVEDEEEEEEEEEDMDEDEDDEQLVEESDEDADEE
eukprot:TRINITY_DN774095_c0_g1_i1.p1 TRINITY_DN774095_c0_g1~~TRINITY_DN774095_c0_g1_i1.p1  ORF type:complete len:227 (-),score=95.68 TRINITY_DN774095_c0_g1_i1:792-1472(-)